MPKQRAEETLSPADRRRAITSILAKGVVRWHRTNRAVAQLDAQKSPPCRDIGLEDSADMGLSVVNGTRRFGLRDNGDET